MIFIIKILIAASLISFASWLSGQYPKLAGFIIALPIASLIAIIFSYYEHQDVEKTITFTKSISNCCTCQLFIFSAIFFRKFTKHEFLAHLC
jgi:hypothetical protein